MKQTKMTFKNSKKYWIFGSAVLLLVVVMGVTLSLTLLNEDWLKTQVEEYVHEKYQTNINIKSLAFNPWKGHALLSEITLNRAEQNRIVAASIGFIEIDVQLIPLVFRDVVVDKLVISQPEVKIDVHRKPEPTPEDTLTRLEKVVVTAAYELLIRPFIEALVEVMEIFAGHIDTTIEIKELIIHDGHINYVAQRDEAAPFALELKELEYLAKNINAKMPIDFASNADITAQILFGETQAEFSQRFSQKPLTLSITDIDVGYLDRYLKQKDVLQINSGSGNISFFVNDEMTLAKIELDSLDLSQNANAIQKDFIFIPAEKLINYVNQVNGNINLEFELEKSAINTSQDLQFVVIEAWEGMWKQILKKVSSDKMKQLKEKGTQKLMNFFNKK